MRTGTMVRAADSRRLDRGQLFEDFVSGLARDGDAGGVARGVGGNRHREPYKIAGAPRLSPRASPSGLRSSMDRTGSS